VSLFIEVEHSASAMHAVHGCTHRSDLRSMWSRRRNLTAFPRTM